MSRPQEGQTVWLVDVERGSCLVAVKVLRPNDAGFWGQEQGSPKRKGAKRFIDWGRSWRTDREDAIKAWKTWGGDFLL